MVNQTHWRFLNQRTRPEEVQKVLANIQLDYKMPFLEELRAVTNFGIESSKSKIEEIYSDNSLATYQIDNSAGTTPPTYVFNPGLNYAENQTINNQTFDAYLQYT